jgi:energy-converting hydrogenase A subunit M
MDRAYDYRQKKRERNHPQLFALIDETNEKFERSYEWRSKEVDPLKKKIDAILKGINYYPKEVLVEKEEELEKLKEKLYIASITEKVLHQECEDARKKVYDYVEKYDLQWARDWGWYDHS